MKDNAQLLKQNIEAWFYHFTSIGVCPNEAAAQAIQMVKDGIFYSEQQNKPGPERERYDSASNRNRILISN